MWGNFYILWKQIFYRISNSSKLDAFWKNLYTSFQYEVLPTLIIYGITVLTFSFNMLTLIIFCVTLPGYALIIFGNLKSNIALKMSGRVITGGCVTVLLIFNVATIYWGLS